MSEGEYWPGEEVDKYGQVDLYGQIEPHHNYGGGGGGGGGGWSGGGGGGGEEVIDGEWYIVDDQQPAQPNYEHEYNVDAYSAGYSDAPEDYGNKFHTWHGLAVTEQEFDRLRHADFVEKTGGRETGGLFGIHTTDFGSGWEGQRASAGRPGLPQSWGNNQPRQLPGGRSAPRLPGANMPRMSAPSYPQLTDGGGIAYVIIGAVLGGIARVFGWK